MSSSAASSLSLSLAGQRLTQLLPEMIPNWDQLRVLDLSDNALEDVDSLPPQLETLIMKGNAFEKIPAAVFKLHQLKTLSLAGNKLRHVDGPFEQLTSLTSLHLGGNSISSVSDSLAKLSGTLSYLYLGGNCLRQMPECIHELEQLSALYLNGNELESISSDIVRLVNLEALHLHYNKLTALPVELVGLQRLRFLSVRGNPLLTNFVEDVAPALPSLKELAARVVHQRLTAAQDSQFVQQSQQQLPHELQAYLGRAHACLACSKTSFGEKDISHIDFLDLCGSFHVPFLQYICSPKCHQHEHQTTVDPITKVARLRKVLLDQYAPESSATVEDLRQDLLRNMAAASEDFD